MALLERAARHASAGGLRYGGSFHVTSTMSILPKNLPLAPDWLGAITAAALDDFYGETLEVVDCRGYDAPEDIAERMSAHLGQAYNNGNVRSAISVFAPAKG